MNRRVSVKFLKFNSQLVPDKSTRDSHNYCTGSGPPISKFAFVDQNDVDRKRDAEQSYLHIMKQKFGFLVALGELNIVYRKGFPLSDLSLFVL